MKTIDIKLYKFEELSEEAKQTAIEKYRENQWEHGEFLIFFEEYCNEKIQEEGFKNPKVQYSLSNCQGDGLSFSADGYDKLEELFINELGKGKEKTAKILAENCEVKITGNSGRYCFASKSDIDLYLENYSSSINVLNTNNIDIVISKVLAALEDKYISLCEELEKDGYNEIDHENSDEYITESIKANEYDFTEDGRQY